MASDKASRNGSKKTGKRNSRIAVRELKDARSVEKAKAQKYFENKLKKVREIANQPKGSREKGALQLVEIARVAQKLRASPLWREAFEKIAPPTRAGSAKYLAVVKYFLPGSAPTARRHADAVEACVEGKWSRKEITQKMLEVGSTMLSNRRRKL